MQYLFLILFFATQLTADNIIDISYRTEDFSVVLRDGLDFPSMKGCAYPAEEGSFAVPFAKVRAELGENDCIDSVKVIHSDFRTVVGEFNLFRVKEPIPASDRKIAVAHDEAENDDDLTARVDFVSKTQKDNFAVLSLFPVKYDEDNKTLAKTESMTLRLFVSKKNAPLPLSSIFDSQIEYAVIIDTSDISGENHGELLGEFDEFIFWKNKVGIPTKIYTLDYIDNSFYEAEECDRIKSFIRYMHENYQTKYVLLVGEDDEDVDDVSFSYWENDVGDWMPRKDVFLFDAFTGVTDDDSIVSDYWYGDTDDDMFPDVAVGRVLFDEYANAHTACSTFVHRTIAYEKNPPAGYLNRMLLSSEEIFEVYEGKMLSESLSASNPPNMEDVKYYDEDGNYDDISVINEINKGVGIYHSAGHGSTYCHMLASGDPITTSDIEAYSDAKDKSYIFFLCSCFTGSVDYDSYIEHVMADPSSGVVASMANSRYGFVDIFFPGRSDFQSLYFMKALSHEGQFRMGDAKRRMNELQFVYALTDPYSKYCMYEYNLYGDPTLLVWTDEPEIMTVIHPDALTSADPFAVLVYESDMSAPISEALVTVWGKNDAELYSREVTDISGGALISFSPVLSCDTLYVTVVKHNRRVYEGEIVMTLDGPSIPSVLSPLDNIKTSDATPSFTFQSSDAESRPVRYALILSENHDFFGAETLLSGYFPSGAPAVYTLPSALNANSTYFYKVRAYNTDNVPSFETKIFSLTAGDDILPGTLSWFKTDSMQFRGDSVSGAEIEASGISLGYKDTMIFEAAFSEDFELNKIPDGWLSYDGNGDGYKFKTGTTSQKALRGYDPPNPSTFYCYYADSDVRQTYTKANEVLYTPAYYVQNAESLKFYCGYGFYSIRTNESFTLELILFRGGAWSSPVTVHSFSKNSTGSLAFSLTQYLPAESIRVYFHYVNTDRRGGAVAVDDIKMHVRRYPEIMSGIYKTDEVSFHDFLDYYKKPNWGEIKVVKGSPSDSILLSIEYKNNGWWKLIPDNVISSNSQGIYSAEQTMTADLSMVNYLDYDTIRAVLRLFRAESKYLTDPYVGSVEIGRDNSIATMTCAFSIEGGLSREGVKISLAPPQGFDDCILYRESSGKRILLKAFPCGDGAKTEYLDCSTEAGKSYSYFAYACSKSDTLISNRIEITARDFKDGIEVSNNVSSKSLEIKAKNRTLVKSPLTLYDVSGRIVMERVILFSNGISHLDVSTLKSGIYFIGFSEDDRLSRIVIFR